MKQGATPTLTFPITNYDLSYATHVWLTLEQNGTQVVRKWARYPEDPDDNYGIEISGQNIIVKLTQEETLGFEKGVVEVQAKMKQDDFDDSTLIDTVAVTEKGKLKVEEGINKDVM